jgi:hypothetical protein
MKSGIHGHIRKLTAKDVQRLQEVIGEKQKHGQKIIGLGYSEKNSKNKILIGFVCIKPILDALDQKYLEKASQGHIKIVINLDSEVNEAKAVAQLLNIKTILYEEDVIDITDAQLFKIIKNGAVCCRLTETSIARIIDILASKKKYVLTSNVSSTSASSKQSDIQYEKMSLMDAVEQIMQGRVKQNNLNVIFRSIVACCTACIIAVIFGIFTIISYRIAPVITTPLVVLTWPSNDFSAHGN